MHTSAKKRTKSRAASCSLSDPPGPELPVAGCETSRKGRPSAAPPVPQSVRSFGETVTKAGWRTIPATYIVCTSDESLPPELQEIFAVRAAAVERMDSGHSLPSIPCLVNSRASSTGWHWLLSTTELLSTENKEKENETTRRSTRRLWRP